MMHKDLNDNRASSEDCGEVIYRLRVSQVFFGHAERGADCSEQRFLAKWLGQEINGARAGGLFPDFLIVVGGNKNNGNAAILRTPNAAAVPNRSCRAFAHRE
jgi:hypothetical protein